MADNFLSQEEIDALLGGRDEAPPAGESESVSAQTDGGEGEEPRNLELILDFPLQLSVRLGEVTKTLEEVRRVVPGTVVELNRVISDPVDVFVNGKLIARGEVVVIEENFGIKITHIFNRLERVKSLK